MIPVSRVVPHLCGLPLSIRKKRLLLMYRGFFDESNRNKADVKFLIAGWVSPVEEWELFSQSWQECLSEEPSIEYFKNSEANQLSGEFYRFNTESSEKKRLSLAKVISSHQSIRGYITTVNHEIINGRPNILKKKMGTRIYDWGFISIVTGVLVDLIQRGQASEKIDFIFDRCPELRACIAAYELQREKFPVSMQRIAGEVIPGDDKELAGLQAADLLAGEYSDYLRTGIKGPAYLELNNAILEVPASPPEATLKELMQYARQVEERERFVADTMKAMKARGITIDDLRKSGV